MSIGSKRNMKGLIIDTESKEGIERSKKKIKEIKKRNMDLLGLLLRGLT